MNTRRTKRITRRAFNGRFLPKVKYSPAGHQKRYANTRPLRPTRRFFQKNRSNRLQRVQKALRFNKIFRSPMFNQNYNRYTLNNKPNNNRNNNNRNNNNANNKREIFVKGLPRYVDNKGLFNLFKNEGRINQCKILYDNVGFSRGIGKIEFSDFRDAWKAINNWNNSNYKGFTLKLEYRKNKNGQTAGNTDNNLKNGVNNKNYGNSSNYVQYNGYSRQYNGNGYNYNNYRYSRYYY